MNTLKYIGDYKLWKIYRNSDGMMEGYKTVNLFSDKKDVQRIITNQTTIVGFGKYVAGLGKTKKKDKKIAVSKLPTLF